MDYSIPAYTSDTKLSTTSIYFFRKHREPGCNFLWVSFNKLTITLWLRHYATRSKVLCSSPYCFKTNGTGKQRKTNPKQNTPPFQVCYNQATWPETFRNIWGLALPPSFCGAHIFLVWGQAKKKPSNRCSPHVPLSPENQTDITDYQRCYSNSKPASYKALVTFWRQVVMRSIYTSSRII